MSSVTGIELGPDCCALVRAHWRGPGPSVSAACLIDSTEWPHEPYELAQRLNQARAIHRLPRRAHVVVWNGLDPNAPADLARILPLQPLISAGFEIGAVLSPAQALASIVWQRHASREQAIAALALNTHGAAIAIVRGKQILYSRMFAWAFGRPFSGARSELLDRYLLVSQLAPQLQHGIRFVRPVHRAVVTSAIACGNLPDLRSLSMLLIQELDLEVETLDSETALDLPDIEPQAEARIAESIAALQLASAAASIDSTDVPSRIADDASGQIAAPGTRSEPRDEPGSKSSALLLIAVAATLMLGAIVSASRPALPIAYRAAILRVADRERVEPMNQPGSSPVQVAESTDRTDQPAGSRIATAPDRVEATVGRVGRRPPAVEKRPALIPKVDGIVISGEHRLAIVGGLIVGPGDRVGPREVARIERDGVVLREPNGTEVFVPIRARTAPKDM